MLITASITRHPSSLLMAVPRPTRADIKLIDFGTLGLSRHLAASRSRSVGSNGIVLGRMGRGWTRSHWTSSYFTFGGNCLRFFPYRYSCMLDRRRIFLWFSQHQRGPNPCPWRQSCASTLMFAFLDTSSPRKTWMPCFKRPRHITGARESVVQHVFSNFSEAQ